MTLNQADAIRMDWGKFLEITNGNLMRFFATRIPESFLPYPKESIEEALNIVAEHFQKLGNKEAMVAVQNTLPFLMFYAPDNEAFEQLKTQLSKDDSYLKYVLPKLGEEQRENLRHVIENK